METPLHTFPVPEPETAKLDDVTNQLRHQPAYAKLNDFIRANPWPCVLAAFVLALIGVRIMR
jgi:hypothetical protein